MDMERKTIVKLCIAAVVLIASVVYLGGFITHGHVTYQLPGPYTAESANDFSTVQVAMTVQGDKITDCVITSSGDNDLMNDATREAWAASIVEHQSADNDVISGATLAYSAASVREAVDKIRVEAGLIDAAALEAAPAGTEPEAEAAEVEAEAEPEAEAPEAQTEPETEAAETEAEAAPEAEASEAQAEPETEAEPAEAETVEAAADPEADAAGLNDGTYKVEKTTDFSTIAMEITVEGGKVTAANIASEALEGSVDMLTDDHRSAWAGQIVEKQAVDAVTGVTVSSDAVAEGLEELLAQAKGEAQAEPEAETAEAEPEAEADAAGLNDGTYKVEKATDFSTIAMEITVEGGKVTAANIASEALEGSVDMLTDDHRSAWAGQIVEKQAVDAVTGVTVSSDAVAEGLEELLAQAKGEAAAEAQAEPEAETAEAEPEAETEAAGLNDGTYKVEKATDFSTIAMEITVEGGKVTAANIASEALEGSVDMLTDDHRSAWAGQIVEKQAVDAVTGVTVSSDAVAEGLEELLAQAKGEAAAETGTAQAAPSEGDRLAAILPHIVTSMGDNKENSYVVDYLEQDPYLVNIYEGYGFAKDYGSARGHEYTLEDVSKTQRPHPKANCITCKTPDMHKLIEQQGVAVYSMPFDEVMAQMTNNVSCYTCHGDDAGNGGSLVVTHQYVNEALGENASAIKPATLSCGQCHIEYYFTPEDSETMMPYHSAAEMTPEAILAYYDAMDFADWTQESTGTRLLKAQHPELETVTQGKHGALLSCADCHMPPAVTDEGVAYRSHLLVSPLENQALLDTCARCHGETDMTALVRDIQAKVTARETEVGNRLSETKDALAKAVASGTWSEDNLNAVRKLHREAQWYFDFCYVENSEGAHNSELAMTCLDTSEAKIDAAMELLSAKA